MAEDWLVGCDEEVWSMGAEAGELIESDTGLLAISVVSWAFSDAASEACDMPSWERLIIGSAAGLAVSCVDAAGAGRSIA